MPVNPADSPVFGTLFGSDAMRAIFDDAAQLQRMLDVEAALARVQGHLGIIPADVVPIIAKAACADGIDTEELGESVRNVGYPVVGLVKGLNQRAGEEAGRWTHWGATTQDIIDTAVALQVRDALVLIRRDLLGTIRALSRQAERHRDTIMAGRTHLQHALPITFGLKCAIWLRPLVTHVQRLDQLRPRVELVQFGGAVGTLASLGDRGVAVAEGLAAELGLGTPAAPWHVARDGLAEAVGFLGLLCGSLAKMAMDVILLAQTEIAEVSEAHVDGRGGSSTMPQKRNQIASEYVLAAQRGVQALVPLMQGAMVDDHERGTGPWQAEQLALPQAFVLSHGALLHARIIAEGLVVDAGRMRRNLEATQGLIMAEGVMMQLAPALGREKAHHVVGHAADTALREGIGLAEALLQEPDVVSRLSPKEIEGLIEPSCYLGSTPAIIDRVLALAIELDAP